jgi:hypothetical protein
VSLLSQTSSLGHLLLLCVLLATFCPLKGIFIFLCYYNAESDGAKEVAAEPASANEVEALRQSARLIIRTLNGLSLDQRIAKSEELLANKPEVAPGMEPAYAFICTLSSVE